MIRVGPPNCVDARDVLVVFLVVPDFAAFAGRGVRDPERERVAARERGAHHSGPRVIARRLRSTPSTATSATAPSCLRVVRRTIRVAEAPGALMRLQTEWRPRPPDERDPPAVGRPRRARVV